MMTGGRRRDLEKKKWKQKTLNCSTRKFNCSRIFAFYVLNLAFDFDSLTALLWYFTVPSWALAIFYWGIMGFYKEHFLLRETAIILLQSPVCSAPWLIYFIFTKNYKKIAAIFSFWFKCSKVGSRPISSSISNCTWGLTPFFRVLKIRHWFDIHVIYV